MTVKQIFNTSAELDYPKVLPTLDLNFANSKTLDPRITFTRASGGSYVGADGLIKLAGVNEPRFDHDPVTGESLGFLVEEARTNLVTYSEQFDNAGWSKSNATVIANQVVAPNGTLTGSLLYPTATSAYTYIQNGWGLTGYATLSVYAKSAGKNFLALWRPDFVGGNAWFNLSTGEVASVSAGTASIVSVGNGWYRCTHVSTVGGFYQSLIISATDANGSLDVTASGTSGIYIWGGQGESSPNLGNFPTSYIPTEGSSRTRAADVASMTGTNFSSWYNTIDGGGTLFTGYAPLSTGGLAPGIIFSFYGSGQTRWLSQYGPFEFYDGTTASNISINPATALTSPVKEAIAMGCSLGVINNYAVSRNGTITSLNYSVGLNSLIRSLNILYIGFQGNPPGYLNGTIARLTYYPKRLTDAQLQVLTS